MPDRHLDKNFVGSIPEFYEKYLVPLIFEGYAKDLARRMNVEPVSRVLEIAAGTGVVTRALVDELSKVVEIVATDLNQAMLDYGATVRDDPNVIRQTADAQSLPFSDNSFDAVVCQFSVMFFSDRQLAYSEARRVLKPGGRFLFNVWGDILENEFAQVVTESLARMFPIDSPRFLARTPHAYFDFEQIESDLKSAGFVSPAGFETLNAQSIAPSANMVAIAYCQGTPLRNEILNRDKALLQAATDFVSAAIEERFGSKTVAGKLQGHVVTVRA